LDDHRKGDFQPTASLQWFADLRPITDPREKTFEEFLAYRIELLPGERYLTPSERTPNELRRLPQIAMELLWLVDVHSEDLQPCAILRWISKFGDNHTITFGPEHARHAQRRQESISPRP
jgi:hypothetical protein